jgi:hypothetical protein
MIASDDRTTPQYLEGFVKSEVEKWAVPIKARGRSWSRLTSLRGARSAPKQSRTARACGARLLRFARNDWERTMP